LGSTPLTAAVGHAPHVLARHPAGSNPCLASAVVACGEAGEVPYGVLSRLFAKQKAVAPPWTALHSA